MFPIATRNVNRSFSFVCDKKVTCPIHRVEWPLVEQIELGSRYVSRFVPKANERKRSRHHEHEVGMLVEARPEVLSQSHVLAQIGDEPLAGRNTVSGRETAALGRDESPSSIELPWS